MERGGNLMAKPRVMCLGTREASYDKAVNPMFLAGAGTVQTKGKHRV